MEVDFIMSLHRNIFGRRQEMHENNVRIRCIGRPVTGTSRLPRRILREMDESVALTAGNTGLNFTLAFDYGAREELVSGARRLLEDHRSHGAPIDTASFSRYLYEPLLPPVDLLIRTSGEHRISNFLLWQSADAPFCVTQARWPDFGPEELEAAIGWWREEAASENLARSRTSGAERELP